MKELVVLWIVMVVVLQLVSMFPPAVVDSLEQQQYLQLLLGVVVEVEQVVEQFGDPVVEADLDKLQQISLLSLVVVVVALVEMLVVLVVRETAILEDRVAGRLVVSLRSVLIFK